MLFVAVHLVTQALLHAGMAVSGGIPARSAPHAMGPLWCGQGFGTAHDAIDRLSPVCLLTCRADVVATPALVVGPSFNTTAPASR